MTRPGEKITVQGRVVDENETCWICEAETVNEAAEVKVKDTLKLKNNYFYGCSRELTRYVKFVMLIAVLQENLFNNHAVMDEVSKIKGELAMREYVTTKQEINKNSLPYNLYQKAKKFGIWNPVDIDFSQDKEDWKKLNGEQQLELLTQFAQFIGGEEAVTQDILPMIMAVSKKGWFEEESYLTTFLFEEAKHAEFFSLFLEEIGVTEDLTHLLSPGYRKLFDETLPAVMGKLLEDQSPEAMIDAAVTYNIFAEGVLAETGYWFFHEALSRANLFPGFISGIRNVKRDEGRHIGFGTFLIQRLISENPELDLFERVQQRLQELLPIAMMLTERKEGEEVTSLGIERGKSMEFAMKQLQARLTVLSRAKGKTLEEIYNTDIALEEV